MKEDNFSRYWAQVEYCHFKARIVELPVSQQLWNQLAEDWAALAQSQTVPKRQRSLMPAQKRWEQNIAA